MKIQLNGHEREFSAPLSLSKLVEQLGMKEDRVAVELNRNIVPREMWSQTALSEGDRLEVVHFVGGGSLERDLRLQQRRHQKAT
jgi:thiamine biosynthesis protein ThiS